MPEMSRILCSREAAKQLPATDRKALVIVAKGNSADFVQSSINTVGASPIIEQALGQSPEELRQDTTDAQNWSVVDDEARALLKGIAAANLVRFHRIGSSALAAYGLAKRLVRQKAHADLLPHVDVMKKLNKIGTGKKSKTAVATPAPVPVKPPVSTTETKLRRRSMSSIPALIHYSTENDFII